MNSHGILSLKRFPMVDIVVKAADMALTDYADAILAIYGLGSPIAVILYDEALRIGGDRAVHASRFQIQFPAGH
jgi:chemotaxis receptor (MCP) glutamine deamidase CheD